MSAAGRGCEAIDDGSKLKALLSTIVLHDNVHVAEYQSAANRAVAYDKLVDQSVDRQHSDGLLPCRAHAHPALHRAPCERWNACSDDNLKNSQLCYQISFVAHLNDTFAAAMRGGQRGQVLSDLRSGQLCCTNTSRTTTK